MGLRPLAVEAPLNNTSLAKRKFQPRGRKMKPIAILCDVTLVFMEDNNAPWRPTLPNSVFSAEA